MKKEFVSPELNTQNFVPNENVAACYLVHCPTHFDSNYNDMSHAGKNQWWEKSRQELLDAGVSESQLDYIDSTPADTAIGSHNLTIALGNDASCTHSEVQLKWDNEGTNFGS